MIKNISRSFKEFLPLKIKECTWNEPTLHFLGKKWSFWSLADWRVTANNKLICGSDCEKNEKILQILQDSQVIRIEPQSLSFPVDPVLSFANGYKLECFSDASYDTWTFHIPNGDIYDFGESNPQFIVTKDSTGFSSISSCFPLLVSSIYEQGEDLILEGRNWKLTISCAWRFIKNTIIFGRTEPKRKGELPDINNCQIIGLQVQSEELPIDPVIIFSNGYILELFSTGPNHSWVWELPEGNTLVGLR